MPIQSAFFNVPNSYTSLVTTTSTGNIVAPAFAGNVVVEAIGGGGNGSSSNSNASSVGGGGGAYARSTFTVTPGTTTLYYSVGAASANSWVNTSNIQPVSTTTGCSAAFGINGVAPSTPGAGGTTANSVGTIRFAGGSGGGPTNGGSGGGGGGDAGAGGNGGSLVAGLGGAGIAFPGGFGAVDDTTAGNVPGGGGGSRVRGTDGVAGNGGIRITFKQ